MSGKRPSLITGWTEGKLPACRRHFELRYGDTPGLGWDERRPVALVGPPFEGIVEVQFLVRYNSKYGDCIDAAIREIEHYLIESSERDPWRYAQYHCGTTANIYSAIQWGYVVPDLDSAVSSFLGALNTFPGFTKRTFTVGELLDDTNWEWGYDDGVYCFVAGGNVLYVGRSLGSTLGARLWDQLRSQSDPEWAAVVTNRSTVIDVYVVDREHRYLASALEAYLIDCLAPRFNRRSQ